MKIKVSNSFLNEIRQDIKKTKHLLKDNKLDRKQLIRTISTSKLDIKIGEHVCSHMENAQLRKLEIDYLRNELAKKRRNLENFQEELVVLEIEREVELAKFRALHRQLDRLGVPFDPVRKATKDALRKKMFSKKDSVI